MARRKLLLLLKPFDSYPLPRSKALSRIASSQVIKYLDNRCTVHKAAVKFCQEILQKKLVDWKPVLRSDLSQPVRDVDLVITIGGDGTLLHASHFIDDSTPVLGVNSDPTQAEEVEEFSDQFDATRSTGYLCAATIKNFEQELDAILEGRLVPSILSRASVALNSKLMPRYALNDILVAHPCPATVSRFSFKINQDGQPCTSLVNCRSSGLRVSTAAGSTAAMLSAGGIAMPILSRGLQYMVREPISPGMLSGLMHGEIVSNQSLAVTWFSKDGLVYIDGSHIYYPVHSGDSIEISSNAPALNVFLPQHFLS